MGDFSAGHRWGDQPGRGGAQGGGVCLNIGCIPSKSLLRNAELAHIVTKQADKFRIRGEPTMDYGVAFDRSREVTDGRVAGVHYLMKKNKITQLHGRGTFIDANTTPCRSPSLPGPASDVDPTSRPGGAWGPAGTPETTMPAPYQARIASLRRFIEAFDAEIDLFTALAHHRLTHDAGYTAIQQIPGIGPVLAAVFVAEIGDVHSFAGPTPVDLLGRTDALPPRIRHHGALRSDHQAGLAPGAVGGDRIGEDPARAELQCVCRHCHKIKTQVQAQRGKHREVALPGPHPGLVARGIPAGWRYAAPGVPG